MAATRTPRTRRLGTGRGHAHVCRSAPARCAPGPTAATHPQAAVTSAVRGARRVLGATAEEVLSPAPQSALNAPIGAHRTLVGYHAGRDELRAARIVYPARALGSLPLLPRGGRSVSVAEPKHGS